MRENEKVPGRFVEYERFAEDTRAEAVTMHRCPLCLEIYDTREEADACAGQGMLAQTEETALRVGDIVIAGRARFGWFDGDPAWVAEKWDAGRGQGLHNAGGMTLYYVVTAITGEYPGFNPNHRHDAHHSSVFVRLATNAMTGEQGYRSGWTGPGHMKLLKVDPQPDLPGKQELIAEVGAGAKALL